MDNQRLFDLVRHQRVELFTAELITKDEYAELAMAHSAVARLEDYDAARAEAAMLREALTLAVDKIDATWTVSRYVHDKLRAALSGSSGEWLERHDGEKDAAIAAEKARADANYQSLERIKQKLSEKHTEHKEALARAEKAEAERDGLRDTLIASINAIGGSAVKGVSDEFLSYLPDEIKGKLARIKAEERRKALLDAAKRARKVGLETVALDLEAMAKEADHGA